MRRKLIFIGLMWSCLSTLNAQSIRVHDPVMIKEGDTHYLFCTGMGISVFSSNNMKDWTAEKPVFDSAPGWAVAPAAPWANPWNAS